MNNIKEYILEKLVITKDTTLKKDYYSIDNVIKYLNDITSHIYPDISFHHDDNYKNYYGDLIINRCKMQGYTEENFFESNSMPSTFSEKIAKLFLDKHNNKEGVYNVIPSLITTSNLPRPFAKVKLIYNALKDPKFK